MRKVKNHLKDYKEFLIPPKLGEIVKGKVIEKTKKGILLEIGNYKVGLVPKEDLNISGKNISEIKKGEEISAKVLCLEGKDNLVKLSLKEAEKDLTWKKLQELSEKREKIALTVFGANKGGLIFNFHGIQGFLPASQLSRENYPKVENPTPEKIFQELKKFVGEEMEIKVLTADSRRQKLIFSEK